MAPGYLSEVESTRLNDGLDMKCKRRIGTNFFIFGLSSWVSGGALY